MSFERIIDYFAKRAIAEIPKPSDRLMSATGLRNSYAELKTHSKQRTLNSDSRAIYGVTRLAGTLSALRAVFLKWPQLGLLKPATILDCGSGPGTALFAAHEMFGEEPSYTAIEKDQGFITMAQQAINDLLPKDRTRFSWIRDVVPRAKLESTHDLTILSYMLSETAEKDLENVMLWALEHTTHYIVITDAGTPKVYHQLMAARDVLISKGWQILAPCPHQKACPMKAPDFCHFSARFQRHQEAKRLKGASAQVEDEKYCYLIAAAPNRTLSTSQHHGRIIKKPLKRAGHIVIDVCTKNGSLERVIKSKKNGQNYRLAKDLEWGDIL